MHWAPPSGDFDAGISGAMSLFAIQLDSVKVPVVDLTEQMFAWDCWTVRPQLSSVILQYGEHFPVPLCKITSH